jgi:benzoate membrane transport protein
MAVLSASGYHIPARSPVTVLGLASVITAPLGGHGVTLAAIIAAICTGPEAHPDPQRRYMAGLVCGALYIVLGIAGGALAGLVLLLPKALVVTAAGLALVRHAGLIADRRADGRRPPRSRLAYLCGGGIGVTIAGLGSPLWAVLAGGSVSWLLKARPKSTPAIKPVMQGKN